MKAEKKKVALAAVAAIISILLLCPRTGTAESVEQAAALHSGSSDWTLGLGYIEPFEGDFENGIYFKIGFEYEREGEAVVVETIFSRVDDTAGLPTDDFDHTLVQAAYKQRVHAFGDKLSLGVGLQHHHIDFGNDVTRGELTVFGLADYDLSDSWRVRLQSSVPMRDTASCTDGCGLRFGGVMLGVDYEF